MQTFAQGPSAIPVEEARFEAEAVAGMDAGEGKANAPSAASAERPVVFISHRCLVQPDRDIALRLLEDLSADCEVYVNTAEPAGIDFDARIEDSLKRADFLIALISESANQSQWVRYEVSYAADRYQQERRPVIIPVRLNFTGQYSPTIGASVRGFNPIVVDAVDYGEIFKRIKATIDGKLPEIEASIIGIESFLVREFRRRLMRAGCLDSPELGRAGLQLQAERLLWVVGDASVRNHFGRSLAIREDDRRSAGSKEQGRNIYEVPRNESWSKVNDTLVRNSIIIFPDVTPALLFEDDARRDELQSLKSLVKRNLVIITASEESFSEIELEMRDRDFEGGARLHLAQTFYDRGAKRELYRRLLAFALEARLIELEQHQWAQRLLDDAEARKTFQTIINKWTPADIERFVTRHLRQVKGQNEVFQLLQRNADLDNEIHAWFIALDDSTRCFVLALAMLSGLRREQVWLNYKLIVQGLKELDQNLSLWPLGICRQRAAPYVTTEGQLDFVDERIAEAIYREVAKNFREYLVELIPLIEKISVPPGREQGTSAAVLESRRLKAIEDRQLRVALASVTGKAARQGLEDLTELLEYWGADPVFQVRDTVALALEQAVTERTGGRQALVLLEKWARDSSNRGEGLYKAWAAASALGSIIAARPSREIYERTLNLLQQLALGYHHSIRFYVSISLKKAARRVPLVEAETPVSLATLLGLVARDERASTKINVAEALMEARMADEAAALKLIREWASGEDADCRWTAICSLFLWRKQKNEERNREVRGFLLKDAQTTAGVLVAVINHKHEKMPVFWQSFKQLVLEADRVTRRALVSGLASLPQASLEERLLPMLRASVEPVLENLVIEARAERLHQMFATPLEFIAELHRQARQEQKDEVYGALALLMRPEPEGARSELVQALVTCFIEREANLEGAIGRLKGVAPSVFEPLSREVHLEGFRRLLYSPPALVGAIASKLNHPDVSGETREALEYLSQPAPRGAREELLQALAHAQVSEAAQVRSLLRQLRAAGSDILKNLVYEFNLRSLDSGLSKPDLWLSRVTEAMRDAQERAEVLQILRQLSEPEPQGRRRLLLQLLGAARVTRPDEVNALLLDSSWQWRTGLFSFSTEVKLFAFLYSMFSPGFAMKVFAPKPY